MKRYCLLIFLPFSLFLISSVFGMEFKIQVITGWNLVSLPVQPSDSSITSIISGHEDDIASVWKWKQGNWAVYIPSFSSDTLDQYAKQKGFYIPRTHRYLKWFGRLLFDHTQFLRLRSFHVYIQIFI